MNDPFPRRREGTGGAVALPNHGPPAASYSPEAANRLVDALNLGSCQRLANFVAVLIGLTSFFGLRHALGGEGGLASWIIPVALALALTAALGGAWHVLLATAARPAEHRPQHGLLLAAGAGLVGVHIATSSLFMATALGGGTALQVHRHQTILSLGEAMAALAEKSERDRALHGELVQAKAAIEGWIACEVGEGCLSATPGHGTVVRELGRVARAFETQALEFDAVLARRPELLAEVRDRVEAARQANLRGNEDAFGAAVNAASGGLAAAGGLDARAMLSGFSTTSRIPEIEQVFRRVRDASARGLDLEARGALPAYEPLDRAAAVLRYADKVPFAWGVAIAVDALPLALLVLLVLSVRRPEPAPSLPAYDFDYRDLLDPGEEIVDNDPKPSPVRKRARK